MTSIRWGHALTGFDQHADAVTVHVAGPDGPFDLRAQYLVGADGGTSMTRKLAGIDFPGMSSYDLVARMGFDVLPPQEWVDPVSGGLDIPHQDIPNTPSPATKLTAIKTAANRKKHQLRRNN